MYALFAKGRFFYFVLFFLLTGINTLSGQADYVPGYYINASDQKVSGYILNRDWKNNPTEFKFKRNLNEEPIAIQLAEAKTFGIGETVRYDRFTVDIDQSRDRTNKLSKQRQPEFQQRLVFLKLLVDGPAKLYLFENADSKRYYFQLNQAKPEALIYKRYFTKSGKIGTNNRYKQQLKNNLICEDLTDKVVSKVDYKGSSLVKLFVRYNQCVGDPEQDYRLEQPKKLTNLHLRVGPSLSSLSTTSSSFFSTPEADFGYGVGLRAGLEIEFLLPFNFNRWSVIIEPSYRSFSGTTESSRTTEISYDLQTVEIPAGIRYHFPFNERNKIFLNTSLVLNFPLVNSYAFEGGLDFSSGSIRSSLAFGGGFLLHNRYQIEARYILPRNTLVSYETLRSQFQSITLLLGYRLY